jgi:hypothetical protein
MAGEALAGIVSLKRAAFVLAQEIKEIDDAARRGAITEIRDKILATQQSQHALMEQINTLEKEIANFETDHHDHRFLLVKASESGAEWSSTPDDYDVCDPAGKVLGRIVRHPQAPEIHPWLWTITTREISPSFHNHGYSGTREQAVMDFKARWAASIRPLFQLAADSAVSP